MSKGTDERDGTVIFMVMVAGIFGLFWLFGDHTTDSYTSSYDDVPEFDEAPDYGPLANVEPAVPFRPAQPIEVPEFPEIEIPSSEVPAFPRPRRYSYSDLGGGYENEHEIPRPEFDEYEAERQARRELQRRGYDYSYGCTIDCSGHQAGWQWRAENDYPTYGSPYGYGNSQSFGEGATAYEDALEDRVQEMRDDYEAGIDFPY